MSSPAPKQTPASPTKKDVLQRAALLLRNASPSEWDKFLNAFADYSQDITLGVIEAAPNEILDKQGRAKMMLSLHRLFVECDKQKPQQSAAPTPPVP